MSNSVRYEKQRLVQPFPLNIRICYICVMRGSSWNWYVLFNRYELLSDDVNGKHYKVAFLRIDYAAFLPFVTSLGPYLLWRTATIEFGVIIVLSLSHAFLSFLVNFLSICESVGLTKMNWQEARVGFTKTAKFDVIIVRNTLSAFLFHIFFYFHLYLSQYKTH